MAARALMVSADEDKTTKHVSVSQGNLVLTDDWSWFHQSESKLHNP
jgi:hypothetical protein